MTKNIQEMYDDALLKAGFKVRYVNTSDTTTSKEKPIVTMVAQGREWTLRAARRD